MSQSLLKVKDNEKYETEYEAERLMAGAGYPKELEEDEEVPFESSLL